VARGVSDRTTGFAVIVTFRPKPGAADRFRDLVLANAADSLRLEPGCRQFDVVLAEGEGTTVVLYEIYEDRAAFDAHMAMPHYVRFAAATNDLIAAKTVVLGALLNEGPRR
jgi:quinol monooxygenase YgiN